jgi:hypothetical protein
METRLTGGRLMRRELAYITLIAAIWSRPGLGEEAPDRTAALYDCGTQALYTLLQLEGRPTDLRRLESHLPVPTPRGYSMGQLRDAAGFCGLELIGVRLRGGARAPDRPALAFLKRGPHGHFVVIRPVGHTGKLVQVIDPSGPIDVTDAANLYASREWTGLALIPARPNWSVRATLLTILILGPALPLLAIRLYRRHLGRLHNAGPSEVERREDGAMVGYVTAPLDFPTNGERSDKSVSSS